MQAVFHITSVTKHAVTIIGADSDEPQTLTPGELADLYQPAKANPDIVVRSRDLLKFENHSSTVTTCSASNARAVLAHAYRLYQSSVLVDLKVTGGKDKHVFAAAKYQPGALKLVPYSPTVMQTVVEGQEKQPNIPSVTLTLKMKGVGTYSVVFAAAPAPKVDLSKAEPLANELVIPYWQVKITRDKELANMIETPAKFKMGLATDNDNVEDVAKIKILTNSKVLREGDELTVYKED